MLRKYGLEIEQLQDDRGVKQWRLPRYPGEGGGMQEEVAGRGGGRQLRARDYSRSSRRYSQPPGTRPRGSRRGTED